MPRTDTIRTKIIDAARRRIGRYGYCKTTMAELAADCGMSPGNLYRYFPGKLDIAAEIARNAFDETIA
ncbi:MAG TPA: TetR/AcrR family transcriptional regulator, partial [Alphaproteobacteria bacterium]|nr:TetR/AcrR family transcriptional regulator [Alphaproteobacteria bacterium]